MRKIDAHALMALFRQMEPITCDEDEDGYEQGARDMWKLLYAAVKAAPTIKTEDDHGKE